MTSKTTIDVIENAMWPRSLVGWLAVILAMIISCFVFSESHKFFINYFKIYKWKNAEGFLIDIELNESRKKIHLTYRYEVAGVKFVGDRIGVTQLKRHDVNNRQIFYFENILKNTQPIVIKYNPENKEDSVYAFDTNHIVLVVILTIFPFGIFLVLFLFILINKIWRLKKYSPRRLE